MSAPPPDLDDVATAAGWFHYWQYMLSAVAGAAAAATGFVWRLSEQLRQVRRDVDKIDARMTALELDRQRIEVMLASLPTRDNLAEMRASLNRQLEHITGRLDDFVHIRARRDA